jgi:hypothetical protein
MNFETISMVSLTVIIAVSVVRDRRELLELRKLLASSAKKHSAYKITIECDNTDALEKLEQVRIAAHQTAAELQRLDQLRVH